MLHVDIVVVGIMINTEMFLILSFFVGNEKMSQHQEVTDADLFSAEKLSEADKKLNDILGNRK